MILRPAPVSTRQFTFDPTSRLFVGEMSSTNGFGRVYDDACDEGMTLFNPRTGCEVVFVVDRTDRDSDGDVTSWRLVPAQRNDAVAGVIVFND